MRPRARLAFVVLVAALALAARPALASRELKAANDPACAGVVCDSVTFVCDNTNKVALGCTGNAIECRDMVAGSSNNCQGYTIKVEDNGVNGIKITSTQGAVANGGLLIKAKPGHCPYSGANYNPYSPFRGPYTNTPQFIQFGLSHVDFCFLPTQCVPAVTFSSTPQDERAKACENVMPKTVTATNGCIVPQPLTVTWSVTDPEDNVVLTGIGAPADTFSTEGKCGKFTITYSAALGSETPMTTSYKVESSDNYIGLTTTTPLCSKSVKTECRTQPLTPTVTLKDCAVTAKYEAKNMCGQPIKEVADATETKDIGKCKYQMV